jgi:hypothetical protein
MPIRCGSAPTKESAELHGEPEGWVTTDSEGSGRTTVDEPVIEVAEVPTVSAEAVARILSGESGLNQQVCRREMQTGSHRAVRICRTRAEIAALELEGKDTFKDLHRSQKEYNQR